MRKVQLVTDSLPHIQSTLLTPPAKKGTSLTEGEQTLAEVTGGGYGGWGGGCCGVGYPWGGGGWGYPYPNSCGCGVPYAYGGYYSAVAGGYFGGSPGGYGGYGGN